ncbi:MULTISPECIES: preprotein translocase subunit YajC [Caproicibacterium]|uniref:Preprotein translocase subunit YajC n=1 Tax=Caproicibacterium argilliputei TaxID=3030016 RepID=A0AA97D8H1_9FIRM|nr:preprotein translocase subunit YajC [Caproicibacterium argilliputei]WOC31000.1 preprotein translocase subunit YajC [Caproicibacterium argilliputei]
MMNPVTLSAATTSGAASLSGTDSMTGMLISFVPLILIFVIMWLILIRPQNKKRKEEDSMRKNAQIGDEITTIGGICGRIVGIKEDNDTLVIETGTDRAKMRIKRWAVGSVDTIHDNPIDEEKPKRKGLFGKKKDGNAAAKSSKTKEEDVL